MVIPPVKDEKEKPKPIIIKPTIDAVGSTDNTPKKYKQNVPRPEAYSTINLSNCFI